MKFNKSRQLLLVAGASLLVAGSLTACGTLTVDFVYVTSAKAAGANNYGEVDVFEINSESGFMRQIPTSPFPSGGRNPVASAVSPDNANLYVVNRDDNSIVQFAIGNDGKLYPQNTVNTPGIFPLAVTVSGSNLFVADTYQPLPGCSPAAPCSGSVAVYPIQGPSGSGDNAVPAGVLANPVANGSVSYWPLSLGANNTDIVTPTAVSAANGFVYVSAYDSTANSGYVFGFWVAPSGTASSPAFATCPVSNGAVAAGALCPINGGPIPTGVHPSALTAVGGQYLYVADYTLGKVLAYSMTSSGTLTPMKTAPDGSNAFLAGNQPAALIADTAGKYLYVANQADSNVIAYSISGGTLKSLGTAFATGLQPVAMGIDPNMHQFLYTANFLGNSVSGFELSATDGSLINSQNTPYTANANPTSVAAIPHNGNTR